MDTLATNANTLPVSGNAASGSRRAGIVALAAGALVILILFGLWPYQSWAFSTTTRSTVLGGWAKWLLEAQNSEWLFCLVVPFLVGWLVWRRRSELAAIPAEGSWWGLFLMALGGFCFWVGFKVDTGYAGFAAAQLLIAGLVILLGGWRWMQALFFPWLFLCFMWPMFPLEEMVASKLRVMTAGWSAKILGLIGISAMQDGSAIFSAANPAKGLAVGDLFRLDVDAKCSGIQSLFSLMMISALYGYLALKKNVPRLLLFISAIPLAVLGNLVRMVLLALGCIWFGPDIAVGRGISKDHQEVSMYHMLCGYAVFAVALSGMFAICSLLEGKHWKRLKKKKAAAVVASPWTVTSPSRLLLQSGMALLVALFTIGVCARTDTRRVAAQPGVILDLPLQFNGYQGVPHEMTAFEKNLLPEDIQMVRTQYISPQGTHMITASAVLSGAGKRDLHRPDICLPAQGFNLAPPSKMIIPLADGTSVEASFLRMTRDEQTATGVIQRIPGVAIYWYVGSDGTTCADYYEHIRVTYQDAILKNINHRWAMIAFYLILPPTTLGAQNQMAELGAIEEMRSFISKLAPAMLKPPAH
jgi:exosortase